MKEKTEIIKSENKIEQTLENEEYESKLTYQEKDGEIIYKVDMKEKTADIEEKYLKKIIEVQDKHCVDQEVRHVYEDDVLCELLKELGYEKLVKQYKSTGKWYA